MSKIVKIFLLAVSALLLFFLGMAVSHFELLPYQQVVEFRKSPLLKPFKSAVRQTSGTPEAVTAAVQNSALQRLLVKEVPLEKFPDLSSTYIVETSGMLHVVSTHGEFTSFDLNSYRKVDPEIPSLPMYLDELRESPLVNGGSFNEKNFRVMGVYAESDDSVGATWHLYVTHHRYETDEACVSFVMSRIELNDGAAASGWETLFTGSPCMRTLIGMEGGSQQFHIRQTSGGAITPYGEDELLFSVGDYGFDGLIHESLLGMPGSMFGNVYKFNTITGETDVFAKGLRNTQGMYTDSSGTVWGTEHGPGGGDEINIIRQGQHYGWPEVTYGIEYGNQPWPHNPEQGRHSGYDKPVYVWINAIAPSNILRIEQDQMFSEWSGDLLVTSLEDRALHRLRVEEDNSIIYSERIEVGYRIRNMQQLSNGSIALMTDHKVLVIIEDGGPVYEPMNEEVKARLMDLNRYDGFLE